MTEGMIVMMTMIERIGNKSAYAIAPEIRGLFIYICALLN